MATRKHKSKGLSSQLVSFLPGSYLDRTSRPIYALVYLLGFLLLYEIGTFYINPEALTQSLSRTQLRVVAFVWFQNLLEYVGFSERMTWIATPFAVIIILIAWQIANGTRWHVRISDFVPMTVECILLALPLLVLSLAMNRPAPAETITAGAAVISSAAGVVSSTGGGLWGDIVTGIGAGIYEELVFRLILICLLMILFQDILRLDKDVAVILSILISAGLFSVHHHFFYVNGRFGQGEPFVWITFLFRMLAGIYFAVIYTLRGFGIVAGTHAFYDIIAAVLNAFWFTGEN
jgi:membrane protease YdiL (CAAX protease family)